MTDEPKAKIPPTGENETGNVADPFVRQEPQVTRFNVATQANQETKDLEKSMFPEIGHGLEGMKDSPSDKKRR